MIISLWYVVRLYTRLKPCILLLCVLFALLSWNYLYGKKIQEANASSIVRP